MTPMTQTAFEEFLHCGFTKEAKGCLRKRHVGKYVDCNIYLDTHTSQVSISWLPKQGTNDTYHDIDTLIAGTYDVMLEIPILASELQQIATILALP